MLVADGFSGGGAPASGGGVIVVRGMSGINANASFSKEPPEAVGATANPRLILPDRCLSTLGTDKVSLIPDVEP
ncbi:hypothetical protein P3T76_002077 [Phytophthora citrophthora]|uniref:Uncharacterized protein n=1 Tax=Phytophthora citrophthora TaxID=4793 RepID=A0AAD9LTT3_9STRA|nr:hypothetical protein P3T76_002077 [Phytophthora citrophthora]